MLAWIEYTVTVALRPTPPGKHQELDAANVQVLLHAFWHGCTTPLRANTVLVTLFVIFRSSNTRLST